MTNDIQQTVEFELEFSYDFRPTETIKHLTFDAMFQLIRSAKRRRAKADRPCFIRDRVVFTDYGRAKCKADPETAARHKGIDEEWKVWK